MWVPPQVLRAAAAGDLAAVGAPAVAAACDVWALAVCLFFLRRGRWPFSRAQICRWPTIPAEQWCDDDAVDFTVPGTPPSLHSLV